MFRFIKAFRKWDKHHRGVSPVIAAILLIGLAVLAGAAVFFIVLPLLSGSADVAFSSVSATDANDDGKVDTIKLSLSNSGTVAAEVEVATGLSGWSVSSPAGGSTTINPGAIVDVTLRPSSVDDQIGPSDPVDFTVSVDGVETLEISETTAAADGKTYASVATVKSITNADLEITDYSTASWAVTNVNELDTIWYGTHAYADQAGDTNSGIRVRTDNNDDVRVYSSDSGDTGYGPALAETVSWDKSAKPVVSFWLKSDRTMPSGNLYVYFTAYSGASAVDVFYFQLDSYLSATATPSGGAYVPDVWTQVVLDFSDPTGWGSYAPDAQTATTVGGFAIRVQNNGASDWDLAFDNIHTSAGL
ncbi:MAG: archaellin/type IV pilin N-terminal domain-containing protein [Candidatus Hodarchaeales archaeon]|jgi:flagellin-like protein